MLTISNRTEPFYRDFFDPPPQIHATKAKGKSNAKGLVPLPPAKPRKVRFHEEVRVRNIKVKGKNRPLSAMYEDDDEEDEYGEQVTFDNFEAGIGQEDEDFSLPEEDDSDESEEGSEERDGRDTIARLKDDLFADEEAPRTSSYCDHLTT